MALKDPELAERLSFLQNAVGAVPGPLDCFLILRGIKTLPLRMERHAANAHAVAQYLTRHEQVLQVFYPGLETNPQVEIARRQMRNGGGMVSFIHAGGESGARKFVESTELFTLAESLGGVESLIEIPALMTHTSTTQTPLAVDPALIRLSVGIEAADDLLQDLEGAFRGS